MLSSIRSRLAAGSKLGLRAFHSRDERDIAITIVGEKTIEGFREEHNIMGAMIDAERPGPELSQFTHRFQPKQIYKPSDFDENYRQRTLEVNEKKGKHAKDPFRRFNINPLDEYKNVALLSNYVTEMGRIKPKHMTGLSAKSQRKIAKAIRRARAFGEFFGSYAQLRRGQQGNLG
ncbi:hypothetical protein EV182_004375 [Spiromyces aspiralis]|uniref:Uncharacterized protein n=1 Tax=Spiromyces aspiralis TaxID=68401 RepID=A0ACC1HF69_9FUNG|nr:hypothetical protein EV182_004375 [Spiromyces aspiralis]